MKKILMTSNTSWYLYNFRLGMIKALINEGFQIEILAPKDNFTNKLEELGCKFNEINFDGKSKNPIKDFFLINKIRKKFKKIEPDLIINSTIKPNIYGSIAGGILKIPVINNVSGLGNIFSNGGITKIIVQNLYKIAYKKPKKVFFQNNDDMNLFIENKIIKREIADRVPGSGVNIEEFKYLSKTQEDGKLKILFIGRMLWDKGVGDLIEVSKKLKPKYNHIEFQLLGPTNFNNPTAISKEQIKDWEAQNLIKYLGKTTKVKDFLREADVVILPSKYREGVPRSLIEAAAMEKPIITYNNVGCKDIVENNLNGYICELGNIEDLIIKTEQFINLSLKEKKEMGKNGREKVKKEFDEKIVIKEYIKAIKEIL